MQKQHNVTIILLFIVSFLTSCTHQTFVGSLSINHNIYKLAHSHHFDQNKIQTDFFLLQTFTKISNPDEPIHIYIEGDGYSWATRNRISKNPTPKNLLVMDLAILDEHPNIFYIARPCQFIQSDLNCNNKYWTSHRYAPEVIAATSQAIDYLKQYYSLENQKTHLTGFSGGAAIAAYLAKNREDVASLRTIAGHLDIQATAQHHNTTPLYGSLNPLEAAYDISRIPQIHFYGENDSIIPSHITKSFVNTVNLLSTKTQCAQAIGVKNVTHAKRWRQNWRHLLKIKPICYKQKI